jgi:hypothetical protein
LDKWGEDKTAFDNQKYTGKCWAVRAWKKRAVAVLVGGGSVAAKFEYTAYLKLTAGKISNMGIFEVIYVYSILYGHFVA